MGISKEWLKQKISEQTNDHAKFSLQMVYNKLVEPPSRIPKELQAKLKIFDPDKVYEEIVRYYIDKKKYSKDRANAIAQQIVQEQQQKRMDKFSNGQNSKGENKGNSTV